MIAVNHQSVQPISRNDFSFKIRRIDEPATSFPEGISMSMSIVTTNIIM